MGNQFKFISFLVTLLIGFNAHALFEAKLTYGFLASKPDLAKMYGGSSELPSIAPTYGVGGDVLFQIPLFPFGLGLRYENMGLKASAGTVEFNAKNTRTAAIIDYRLIDTLLYVGPIFTYGLSHNASIGVKESGTEISSFTSNKVSSYSIGLEAGAHLVGFLIGAEVGTETLMMKSATDSKGVISGSQDINMSGSYAKILFGISI